MGSGALKLFLRTRAAGKKSTGKQFGSLQFPLLSACGSRNRICLMKNDAITEQKTKKEITSAQQAAPRTA